MSLDSKSQSSQQRARPGVLEKFWDNVPIFSVFLAPSLSPQSLALQCQQIVNLSFEQFPRATKKCRARCQRLVLKRKLVHGEVQHRIGAPPSGAQPPRSRWLLG